MSAKNLDRHNRWRSKTVAFRMSPEEADQLDTNVRLSGLTNKGKDVFFVATQDEALERLTR